MTTRLVRPSLAGLQLLAATVDGVALSTIVLHVTTHLDLAPAATGAVLAVAAAAALLFAGPLGSLADRCGLRRAAAAATAGSAAALLGYAVAGSLLAYAVSAVVFVVAQAVAGSVRQALAATDASPERRTHVRAVMHTLLNAGMGAGTVVGAGVAAVGTDHAFRTTYLLAGLAILVAAAVALRLHGLDGTDATSSALPAGLAAVAADRRFLAATTLASLVQLTMPVLSVLLPVWVLERTAAPAWTAGAALGVNTLIVIAVQRAWTARLVDPRTVARSARIAAAGLLGATALLARSGGIEAPAATVAVVALAVVVLTLGEISGGAATWAVALGSVPDGAEGRYQAVFSMSASAARVLGPAVALPLVLALGAAGWIALGAVMAAACLGIAHLSRTISTTPERKTT